MVQKPAEAEAFYGHPHFRRAPAGYTQSQDNGGLNRHRAGPSYITIQISGIRTPTSGYDPAHPVRYADATSVERLASYIALSALRMSPSGWSSKLE